MSVTIILGSVRAETIILVPAEELTGLEITCPTEGCGKRLIVYPTEGRAFECPNCDPNKFWTKNRNGLDFQEALKGFCQSLETLKNLKLKPQFRYKAESVLGRAITLPAGGEPLPAPTAPQGGPV